MYSIKQDREVDKHGRSRRGCRIGFSWAQIAFVLASMLFMPFACFATAEIVTLSDANFEHQTQVSDSCNIYRAFPDAVRGFQHVRATKRWVSHLSVRRTTYTFCPRLLPHNAATTTGFDWRYHRIVAHLVQGKSLPTLQGIATSFRQTGS
jgi:hypothetical protein